MEIWDIEDHIDREEFNLTSARELQVQLEMADVDVDDVDPENGLWFMCGNVWLWCGGDGAGVPEHTDKRVGDVSMICMKGSRWFNGYDPYGTEISEILSAGDRVEFDSNYPHSVENGEGECILMCCGD